MKKKILIFLLMILILIIIIETIFVVKNTNKPSTAYTYLFFNSPGNDDELKNVGIIYTFDENNICIDERLLWDFANEEIAKENYENWKEIGYKNLEINSNKVSFNATNHNGLTKEEIKDNSTDSFIDF